MGEDPQRGPDGPRTERRHLASPAFLARCVRVGTSPGCGAGPRPFGSCASMIRAGARTATLVSMSRVVMLCTGAPGGIAQVVSNLRDSGLFSRFHVRLIVTHRTGSVASRLVRFLFAATHLAVLLLAGQVTLVHAHVTVRGSFWRKSILLALTWL